MFSGVNSHTSTQPCRMKFCKWSWNAHFILRLWPLYWQQPQPIHFVPSTQEGMSDRGKFQDEKTIFHYRNMLSESKVRLSYFYLIDYTVSSSRNCPVWLFTIVQPRPCYYRIDETQHCFLLCVINVVHTFKARFPPFAIIFWSKTQNVLVYKMKQMT